MADGAVLLSAIVDALCSIFHMFIEAVRQIRPIRGTQMVGFMATSSEVVQHASKAVSFLNVARDQLIREVDGRDDNDTIGPVLTPQAITITVIERLVSGVYHSGTLDIIGLYEECLEHLVRIRSVTSTY